jgi:HlyD family secretion protein
MKRWLIILVALFVIGGGAGAGVWYWQHSSSTPNYKTATVQRGNLQFTISATGTVEPEEVIDVGAQVAGQILELGSDPSDLSSTANCWTPLKDSLVQLGMASRQPKKVDYRTPVFEGTVLARIDPFLYESDYKQAVAAYDVANAAEAVAVANEKRAEADLGQMQAKYEQANNDWQRIQKIRDESGAITSSESDMYKANFLSAKSTLEVGKATLLQPKSSVTQAISSKAQAEAARNKAQKNLDYCTIRSTVNGVIIDRRVNEGQTVVSSLNTPSLFLIAKDLKRMQVWVQVNEADIGQIHEGQSAMFTCDAFPGETFHGTVGKIRLNATMTNNVVTYTVEVVTDNSSGKLLPYLTANLQFEVGKRTDVLLVPNSALRWWPQASQIAPDAKDETSNKGKSKKDKSGDPSAPKEQLERGFVWVRDGKYVRPVKVRYHWTDGTMTEIQGEGVHEGMEVITGEVRQTDTSATSNPFAPQMFGGKKQ